MSTFKTFIYKDCKKSRKKSKMPPVIGDTGEKPAEGEQQMSENLTFLQEMLNGVLPGSYTPNVMMYSPNETHNCVKKKKPKGNVDISVHAEEEEAYEEDEETKQGGNKIDRARQLFQSLINRPNMSRLQLIQNMENKVGITHSTAVSYYERLAKEAGITGKEDKEQLGAGVDMGMGAVDPSFGRSSDVNQQTNQEQQEDVISPEDRQGILRTVPNAHLIYKEQSNDGSFTELWIYNVKTKDNQDADELKVRRSILSGTDIPPKSTRSPDGSQAYSLTTLGNAQYLYITGLPN